MVRIEPEIIQCAPANRIGILVLRKRFGVPRYGIGCLSESPRCAAVTLIVKRAIVCPARLLWRRVKAYVAYVDSGSQRHAEGLDSPIQVLVIKSVLVVPESRGWIRHFVSGKPNPVIARIRLNLVHSRACPRHDGRLHPYCGAKRGKCETARAAGNRESTIGDVVIHVALTGVRLAP